MNTNMLKFYLLISIVLVGCNSHEKDCLEKNIDEACNELCILDRDFRGCLKQCELDIGNCSYVYETSASEGHQNYDIDARISACVKACNNENNNDENDRLHHSYSCTTLYNLTIRESDKGKDDLNVTSTLCKHSDPELNTEIRNKIKSEACAHACKTGDSEACAILNEVTKEKERLEKEEERLAKEREECHVSKWEMNEVNESRYLHNVSWQSEPVMLGAEDLDDCFVLKNALNTIKVTGVTTFNSKPLTEAVYKCAATQNNTKLMEVAKKCQGKWF